LTATLLSGGIVAAIVGFWEQLKNIWFQIKSVIIVTFAVDGDGVDAVLTYLTRHYKEYTIGPKVYTGAWMDTKKTARQQLIAWQLMNLIGSFYHKGNTLLFVTPKNQSQNSSGADAAARSIARPHSLTISYLRGMFKSSDDFIKVAFDFHNSFIENERKYIKERFFVRHIIGVTKIGGNFGNTKKDSGTESVMPSSPGYDKRAFRTAKPINFHEDEIGSHPSYIGIDGLALTPLAEQAIEELREWSKSEKWYTDRQIPYRFGLGLYGTPGNGKTMLARGIAEELDMPIFVFDLSSLSNDEMVDEWRRMLSHTPCIALMEDIDNVFHGRDNIANGGLLSFDCLLNCISGIEKTNGLLTIITTNHVEQIDPALGVVDKDGYSSRPGRIDRMIEMKNPDSAGREKIALRIFKGETFDIEKFVADGDGKTGAQFQDMCTQAIMKKKIDIRKSLMNGVAS
jgi:hypothetical protein